MTKISQLPDLGDNLAAGDEFVIRDITDISTPNKKVTASGFANAVANLGLLTSIAAGSGPQSRVQCTSSGSTHEIIFTTSAAERLRINSAGQVASSSLGSAATPIFTFSGDTNTGIYSPGADQLAVATNGVGRLFINSLGSVGIGTTTPNRQLEVSGAGGVDSFVRVNALSGAVKSGIEFSYEGTTYAQLYYNNASPYDVSLLTTSTSSLIFGTNNTERCRLDASGRLLVGTSTARETWFNSSTAANLIQIERSGFNSDASISMCANSNGANGAARVLLGKTRGSSVGATTVVTSGDLIGAVSFQGADGTELVEAASIEAYADGTPGANDMPGRLVFSTTADGASSPTEAMRINNQREVLIGTTTRTANGGVLQVSNGITFPATAVACTDVNTLDDYEEGTWTPVWGGDAVSTYTSRTGTYTKIGNRVVVFFDIRLASIGGSGSAFITGLPFTPNGEDGATGAVLGTSGLSSLSASLCATLNGDTNLYPYTQGSTSRVNWLVSTTTASAVFSGTITYKTA